MYGLAFAVLALCLVPVGVAQATTFTVDSTDDGPDVNTGNGKCATSVLFPKCTLRAAVMEANGLSGGPHTIIVPAGTYLLSRVSPLPDRIPEGYGPLPIFKSMNITGSGGIAVIRGASGWPHRIFVNPSTLPVTLSMSNLDIGNGHPADGHSGGAININNFSSVVSLVNVTVRDSSVQGADGGGISSNGTLTLDHCVIKDNTAALAGGGIESFGAASINESTISGNQAQFGGGIASFNTLTVSRTTLDHNIATFEGGGLYNNNSNATVTNVTLFSNTANTHGGGIWNEGASAVLTVDRTTFSVNAALSNGGAIGNSGRLTVKNSTMSGNGAFAFGGGIYNSATAILNNVTIASNSSVTGGGIMNESGTLNVGNSIVAGNNASTGPDCGGSQLGSLGFNLIQNAAGCSLFGIANIVGQNPLLGPLQQNGGFAATRALGPGSPAIDSGTTTLGTQCELIDERQVRRPQDGNADGQARCDIGAFEVAPVGAFDLSPGDSAARVGDLLLLGFRWTAPGSWRDLNTLQLRLTGEDGVVFSLLWDQQTNTFRLLNDDRDGPSPSGIPGANQQLEGRIARLILDTTTVQGSGPQGHDVTLTLALIFKVTAAEHGQQVYRIEAAAADDFGNQQGFAQAGTVTVVQQKRP